MSKLDTAPVQRYPGESAPRVAERDRYPLPHVVCGYGTREEFEESPVWVAQWVHWHERAELVLRGKYKNVFPLHFEGILTLVCNFMCPHCTQRTSRLRWVDGSTWQNNAPVVPSNTMSIENIKKVLEDIANYRMDSYTGVVWGGGDPTAYPWVYEALRYAKGLGIKSCFLTNGVFMDVEQLVEIQPVVIRISLDCGTEAVYRRFHGYPEGWNYFARCLDNMRTLARRKLEKGIPTLFGVSLILDERNLGDAIVATKLIRSIVNEAGAGSIDYAVLRPVFNYRHLDCEVAVLRSDTKPRAHSLLERDGEVREILEQCGVAVVIAKDSFDPPPPDSYYDSLVSGDCLAYGWCGQVRHNGDVQLCSDSYGNPDFTIGNVLKQDLKDIWRSERRLELLEKVNRRQCFRTSCPHTSRGHHLNRIFHQIEVKRREGRIDEVRTWVSQLQEVTLPLGHSFFI